MQQNEMSDKNTEVRTERHHGKYYAEFEERHMIMPSMRPCRAFPDEATAS